YVVVVVYWSGDVRRRHSVPTRRASDLAGGRVAGEIGDLGGQRVGAAAQRDVAAPAAVALDDGGADRRGAVEDRDRGAGIGDVDRSGERPAGLQGRAARAGDGNRRSGLV